MKTSQAEVAEYIGDLASELAKYARKHDLHHMAYCLDLTVADAMKVAGTASLQRLPEAFH